MKMRKFMFLFAVMFAFSTVFVACGGGEATDEETTDETTEVATDETAADATTVDYTKGKEVYASNCQACHQAEGAGLEGAFPSLKGLTIEKEEVIKNIKDGKSTGTYPAPMVSVELSEEDASAVADYVLSLQ